MAPKARGHVLNLHIDPAVAGGGVLESQLVDDLYDALEPDQMEQLPHLINLSAGCPTRLDLPAQSFVHWRADVESIPTWTWSWSPLPATTPARGSFWPASFAWAVGRRVTRP